MVICPRCQQPIDETARTTCPLCSTPISAPANTLNPPETPGAPGNAPYPMASASGVTPLNGPAPQPAIITATATNIPVGMPTLAANQRMTLSGDVIEAPAPMTQSPIGNSQYKAKSSFTAARRDQAPPKSDKGPIIKTVLMLLLVSVGAFGGWYYWMHRTTPKEQTTKYFNAAKAIDTKTMYELEESDPDVYKDEQEYADKQNALYEKMPQLKNFTSSCTFIIGDPKYTSMTEATVPVTVTGSIITTVYGQTKTTDVNETISLKMKNFNGIWKKAKGSALGSLSGGM